MFFILKFGCFSYIATFTPIFSKRDRDLCKYNSPRLQPLHPLSYKKIRELKGARDAFEFVDRYAKENNIPLIGSFNPADEGLTESDFYDGPHVRKEIMDKIVERELF